MKKATSLLFTGAFSLGCVILWMLLALYGGIYGSLFHHVNHVLLTEVLVKWRHAILLVPIPFISYCVASAFRKPLTAEGILFYAGILAFVFLSLVLLV
jgi:hypothetical protein